MKRGKEEIGNGHGNVYKNDFYSFVTVTVCVSVPDSGFSFEVSETSPNRPTIFRYQSHLFQVGLYPAPSLLPVF